ncbi:IS3 family transposase [Morganella psychrotolerans]
MIPELRGRESLRLIAARRRIQDKLKGLTPVEYRNQALQAA